MSKNTPKQTVNTQYPCGICNRNAKFSAIWCTGTCKKWFHSSCLKWPSSKIRTMKNNEIENWQCETCSSDIHTSSAGIEELETSIQNLSAAEKLDTETSLCLAAEAGNALLEENSVLKQQLHDLKLQKSEYQYELEDKLLGAYDKISSLEQKITNLEYELTQKANKISEEQAELTEINMQNEAEKENTILTCKIEELLATKIKNDAKIKGLDEKIHSAEKVICSLNESIVTLTTNYQSLEAELQSKTYLLDKIKSESGKVVSKLSKQEMAMTNQLSDLFYLFRTHLKSLHVVQSDAQNSLNEEEQEALTKDTTNSTRKKLQLTPPLKKTATKMKSTSINKGNTTDSTLENELQCSSTATEFCAPNKKPDLSLKCKTAPDKELELLPATTKPLKATNNQPPSTAKKLEHNESLEEFFNKNIDEARRENLNYLQRFTTFKRKTEEKNENHDTVQERVISSPTVNQLMPKTNENEDDQTSRPFLAVAHRKVVKYKTRIIQNSVINKKYYQKKQH